ncbi:MAG: hypothetical protein IPN76_05690 [Saprospiraceae bacterium]|nr:hypothetical protein [Saprospiraceae bacterium]
MEQYYTQLDLIRYIYRETSATETLRNRSGAQRRPALDGRIQGALRRLPAAPKSQVQPKAKRPPKHPSLQRADGIEPNALSCWSTTPTEANKALHGPPRQQGFSVLFPQFITYCFPYFQTITYLSPSFPLHLPKTASTARFAHHSKKKFIFFKFFVLN